ncbi:MAG: TonB-dependent receptor, partial [Paludibacter sp.]
MNYTIDKKIKSVVMKSKYGLSILLLLSFIYFTPFLSELSAQTKKTVKGIVSEVNGDPIIGANVTIKGTNVGTLTSLDGSFTLSVPTNALLKISYIGYESQEIVIKAKDFLRITLREDSKSLDEVVVIGYGTSTKRDLTSAVSKVDISSVQNVSVASVNEALAGRMAGVQVTSLGGKPGEAVDIVIRGANSITSNSSPLYVIDGFVMTDAYINTINPNDIESLEVLKDASATSIYGARGANGVLIITSKKGKVGKPTISYKTFYGTQKTTAHVDVLTPYEFVNLQMTLSNGTATSDYLDFTKRNPRPPTMTLEDYKTIEMVDYQNLLFRDAPIQSHSLSVSGGTQDTKYIFSGSYFKQDGVIIGSSSDRYTAKLGIDQNFSKQLRMGITGNFSLNTTSGADPNSYSSNLMHSAWSYIPFVYSGVDPANNENITDINDQRNNPILTALNELSSKKTTAITGNAYLEYEPVKGLIFKVLGSLSSNVLARESFNNFKTKTGRTKGYADGSISQQSTFNWMNDYTVNYSKTFKQKHKFSALLGFTASGRSFGTYSFGAQNLTRDDLGLHALAEGTPKVVTVTGSASTIASGISRVTYGYNNRYLFSASFRADGSSKFGANNRWAYFPSTSGAWVLSQEKFMKPLQHIVSNTKIRASWGRTGNNSVDDFATYDQYIGSLSSKPYTYYFGNAISNATIKTSMANPNLKWETTEQTDLGLDIGLFKQRVRIEADYFYKKTYDLLLNAEMPNSIGFDKSYMNLGKVQNQGFEFSLFTENIRTKKFRWSTDFNISFIRNKVVELANAQPTMTSNLTWAYIGDYNTWNNFPAYVAIVGKPLSQMYGYISDGLLSNVDIANNYPTARGASVTPGYMKFKDINGDGKIDQSDR